MKASTLLPANYVTLKQLKERREEEERLRKLKEEEERLRKLKEEEEEEQERLRKLKEEEEENRNHNQRRDELWRSRGGTDKPDKPDKPFRGRAPVNHHRSRPPIAAADPDSNPKAAAGAPVSEPTKSQVPAKREEIPIADEATGLEDGKVAADRVEGKKKKYRKNWKKNFKKKTKGIRTADEPSPEIQAGDGCDSCLAVEAVESGPEKAPPPAMPGRFTGEYRPVRVSRGEVDRTAEIERKIGYLTVRGVGGAGREGEGRRRTVGMNPRGSGFGRRGGGGAGMMWVRKSTES